MTTTDDRYDVVTGIRTVTQNNGDGTGTRTVYSASGAVASTTSVTGLYVAPIDDRNALTLRQQADAALTTNATYIALTAPTAAQTAAQVKMLTRELNGLIRLTLGRLEATT
jgi:hypothetical protein